MLAEVCLVIPKVKLVDAIEQPLNEMDVLKLVLQILQEI
jgi:hypothetical protein